ncbi:MAG: hypothetical protein AB7O45_10445 [Alphaproteobacteria bacterium]
MRLLFIDGSELDYGLDDIDQKPLGGSQSAFIQACHGLAARGHAVTAAGSAYPHGRPSRGVAQVALGPALGAADRDPDRIVVLNAAVPVGRLRARFGARPIVVWMQNDAASATATPFADPAARAAVDRWIFVSEWQRTRFAETLGVPPAAAVVVPNPIAAPFLDLCPPDAPILAGRDPDRLVYLSAPNRGLGAFRALWPLLRHRRPALRLDVYSGFLLDQGAAFAPEQTARIEALLADLASMPGIAVHRGLDKPALAARLRAAAMVCYPATFRETSCIAVLEAMAAGCLASVAVIGALEETTAGFAALTPVEGGTLDLVAFARASLRRLAWRDRDPAAVEAMLRRQVDHVRALHGPEAFVERIEAALQAPFVR